MVERASITEKALNTLRFTAGGEVRKEEQKVSTDSKSLKDLYFEEVKNYNIDKKTAGKYFRTAATNPKALTALFDQEVAQQLANVLARARQNDALRQEHQAATKGIMRRRKAIRESSPTTGAFVYRSETPATVMMQGISQAFRDLRSRQKPISIDKIKIDVA